MHLPLWKIVSCETATFPLPTYAFADSSTKTEKKLLMRNIGNYVRSDIELFFLNAIIPNSQQQPTVNKFTPTGHNLKNHMKFFSGVILKSYWSKLECIQGRTWMPTRHSPRVSKVSLCRSLSGQHDAEVKNRD